MMGTGARMRNVVLPEQHSVSKGFGGQKRGVFEVEDTADGSQKRLKMRDLDSIIRSEAQAGTGGSKKANQAVDSDPKVVDLDVNVECNASVRQNDSAACTQVANKLSGSCDGEIVGNDMKSGRSGLDSNAHFPSKERCRDLKLRDDSDCRSSVEESDSMRVWNGLKQHDYMSYSHETVPVQISKRRGRKKKINVDVVKKKTELVQKEQVDKFVFLAPPSGLLSGLSPGIINRVRNSKQVLSIIEALVRSERNDNQHSRTLPESNVERARERLAMEKEREKVETEKERESAETEKERERLEELKISSPVKTVSEHGSCLSTMEPGDFSSVSSLPVEAANVAYEWLGLLSRDIKARLAALGRSKARFFAVISTELPLLISKEFPSSMEKGNHDAHVDRWTSLFDRMYKTLSEEETQLESELNQVNELQRLCERGLYKRRLPGNTIRSGEVDLSKNLELMAAAASIYSTCTFLSSQENRPFG